VTFASSPLQCQTSLDPTCFRTTLNSWFSLVMPIQA
jgi:hypothetical protein